MDRRRRLLLVAAALCAAAIVPSQALAAPPFYVEQAKHKGGPFAENNGSSVPATVKPGHTKSVYWRINSNGGDPHTVTLDDSVTSDQDTGGLRFKWFRKNKNITHDVEHAGFDFTLKFDQPKVFRTEIKSTGPGDVCLGANFSQTTPSIFDDDGFFAVNNDDACV